METLKKSIKFIGALLLMWAAAGISINGIMFMIKYIVYGTF